MSALDRTYLAMRLRAAMWKEALADRWTTFRKEEHGGTEVVAVILILVVVVGLAVVFKEKIGKLVNKLWEKITTTTDTFDTNIPET